MSPGSQHLGLMSGTEEQLSLTRAPLSISGGAKEQIPINNNGRTMPLDAEFLDDCPYQPEAVLLDEIVEIDKERSLVRARMTARPVFR